ncbi:hypothetical protein [Kistimonas asteriae]|uniref:hypothetical protein n=1 Tax=Kistimonas asteriae TaxID=517724 RepID=UPI001BAB7FC2|nr:hypothetical protein [Kistimonas asteriae]
MSDTVERMRTTLDTKLGAVMEQLKTTKNNLEAASGAIDEGIHSKLEDARVKVQAKKQEADVARERLKTLIEVQTGDIKAQVAQWKANHEHDKLVKHADRAEDYAGVCIELAMAAAVEAEEAVLQAIAARMDVESAS